MVSVTGSPPELHHPLMVLGHDEELTARLAPDRRKQDPLRECLNIGDEAGSQAGGGLLLRGCPRRLHQSPGVVRSQGKSLNHDDDRTGTARRLRTTTLGPRSHGSNHSEIVSVYGWETDPGTLLVVNHTAASMNLTKTCQPSYAVALTNSKYAPRVAFATVCSSAPFVIAPGTNRFPISITTTYLACQQSPSSSSDLPTCIKSGAPPLPAGTYDAVLIGDGLALPRPQPVPVVLVE